MWTGGSNDLMVIGQSQYHLPDWVLTLNKCTVVRITSKVRLHGLLHISMIQMTELKGDRRPTPHFKPIIGLFSTSQPWTKERT